MKNGILSHFSPNLMSKTSLESLFVQREALAKKTIELILNSLLTKSNHNTLFIGSRGIGKTYFISLIYHRLKGMLLFSEKATIAWLREEEWGINSFLDLFIQILSSIASKENHPHLVEQINSLYELPLETAEEKSKEILEEFLGNRVLVILVENLDEIFKRLGTKEQQKLRTYIQNKPCCTILATAQSVFDGVSLKTSPFYDFFHLTYLEPLDIEDAIKLLTNITEHKKNKELAAFIATSIGKARIRAIHHLIKGNHRVYTIFSEFLNTKSLDELVEPFIQTLDNLTPYYQSRLKDISPQQRKIVEYLCQERRAVSVKEIAQRSFMTHQTTSSNLKYLKDNGYVLCNTVGRESYYELQDLLMRLCLEVKMHQDKPIRLFVDFLRHWYSTKNLDKYSPSPLQNHLENSYPYLTQVVEIMKNNSPDLIISACIEDWKQYFEKGDFTNALQAIDEIISIQTERNQNAKSLGEENSLLTLSLFERINCLLALNRWEEGYAALKKVLSSYSILKSNYPINTTLTISILFNSTRDVSLWQNRIHKLVETFDKYQVIYLLGKGLVENIKLVVSPTTNIKTAETWKDLWKIAVGESNELKLELKFLDAAIKYTQSSKDPRVLLGLPIEERQILNQALAEIQA